MRVKPRSGLLLPFLSVLLLMGVAAGISPHPGRADAGGKKEASPPGEIRFLVLGDWGRRGGATQRKVAGLMGDHAADRGADFVVTTGDNFYEDGVRSADDEHWRRSFQEVYTAPSLDVPWFPVLGNHDYRGSTQAQIDYTGRDGRWRMPARYHSFERPVGSARALFVFLDTNPIEGISRWWKRRHPDLGSQDGNAQLLWLDKVLGESTAEWKIVTGHHPVFSAGAMHGSSPRLEDRLGKLFERHGVDVYFSGHDHNLQHLKPPGRTHYVVSGGGSEPRRAGSHRSALFARGVGGFVSATLREGDLSLEFIGPRGEILYRASVPSRSSSPARVP